MWIYCRASTGKLFPWYPIQIPLNLIIPKYSEIYLEVSWNGGTPKSSTLIGFSWIFHDKPSSYWGGYHHLPKPPFCTINNYPYLGPGLPARHSDAIDHVGRHILPAACGHSIYTYFWVSFLCFYYELHNTLHCIVMHCVHIIQNSVFIIYELYSIYSSYFITIWIYTSSPFISSTT